MAPTLLSFIFVVQFCTIFTIKCNGRTIPRFPAILIFGDSLLDTGNNNFINTPFKANHWPYGLAFPGGVPTGRFSNGKLISDFMASALGIKETVPPFLDPNLSDYDIRTGVCFASAGSGYDDVTTAVSGVIPVSAQTEYFRVYIERLKRIVGEEEGGYIIRSSLVLVTSGSNDMAFDFYDSTTRSFQFTVGGYQNFLQQRIQMFVQELYSLGCRNMIIAGLPPIGCGPSQITAKFRIARTCLADENVDAQAYNQKLVALLPQLQASLPGSRIAYADIYTPLMDMIINPLSYGFWVTDRGCCGTGLTEAGPLCSPVTPFCPNPSQYLFWDSIHPGEKAYRYITRYWLHTVLPHFSETSSVLTNMTDCKGLIN